MRRTLLGILMIVALGSAPQSRGQAASLKVGDPAPALAPGRWLHAAEAVERFEPGKIYVVDFFASWCGPCKLTIPRVNLVAQKYKDRGVVVIGVAVLEKDWALVEPFVEKMGAKMTYPIAVDNISVGKDGAMMDGWMTASGSPEPPASVIIDREGRVAWIGNPANGLDRVIASMLDGRFNAAKEVQLKENRIAYSKLLGGAARQHDIPKLVAFVDEITEKDPEFGRGLQSLKFQALFNNKNYKAAYDCASAAAEMKDPDADGLNVMAWLIVDTPGLPDRNLDVAFKAASAAAVATDQDRAEILDTLARVEFERGNLDQAIQIQTRAVAKSDTDLRAELIERLNKYESKKRNKGK